MNYLVHRVLKEKNTLKVFKTCDFMAIKNKNETYLILRNNHGFEGLVTERLFKEELVKSSEPFVLNVEAFEGMI